MAAVVCLLLSVSANSFAQGCASCYTTAAAGGPQTAHALRSGILMLIFPPTLIFAGIILVVRNWKNVAQDTRTLTTRERELKHLETRNEGAQ